MSVFFSRRGQSHLIGGLVAHRIYWEWPKAKSINKNKQCHSCRSHNLKSQTVQNHLIIPYKRCFHTAVQVSIINYAQKAIKNGRLRIPTFWLSEFVMGIRAIAFKRVQGSGGTDHSDPPYGLLIFFLSTPHTLLNGKVLSNYLVRLDFGPLHAGYTKVTYEIITYQGLVRINDTAT